MKKIIKTGLGFGIGSMVLGRIGGMEGAHSGVSGNVNSAMELGSLALPIMAAKKVTKSTKNLL